MNNDGSNLKFIVKGYYPEFSPDGNKILYQYPDSSNWEGLYIMNVDGTNAKFLTTIPYQTMPRFSPDGKKIIFSNFTTNYDIYSMNIDGSNLADLTNSKDGETQPLYTPDGSKIVFTKYDISSNINMLCSMNVDGTDLKIIYRDSSNYGMVIF